MATILRPTRLEDDARLRTKVDHVKGTKQPSGQKLISYNEVQKHVTADDCWVIIDVSRSTSAMMCLLLILGAGQGLRRDGFPGEPPRRRGHHPPERRQGRDVRGLPLDDQGDRLTAVARSSSHCTLRTPWRRFRPSSTWAPSTR